MATCRVPKDRGVPTCRYLGNRQVFFTVVWTFKPMLLPLKQHSFKKQSNRSINYTNTFDLCLNNVPSPNIFRRLPGSRFNIPITLWKVRKNGPRTSLIVPEWTDWGKNRSKKISRDSPFKMVHWKDRVPCLSLGKPWSLWTNEKRECILGKPMRNFCSCDGGGEDAGKNEEEQMGFLNQWKGRMNFVWAN